MKFIAFFAKDTVIVRFELPDLGMVQRDQRYPRRDLWNHFDIVEIRDLDHHVHSFEGQMNWNAQLIVHHVPVVEDLA